MEIEYLCSMACVFTSLIQISYNFTFNKFGRLITLKYLQTKNSRFMEVVLKLRNYIRKNRKLYQLCKSTRTRTVYVIRSTMFPRTDLLLLLIES